MQVCKIGVSYNLKDQLMFLIIEIEVYMERQRKGLGLGKKS